MNHYETIFIIDPDTTDAERDTIMGKVDSAFSQKDGTLLMLDNWGIRKMAYEIKKKKQGRYVRLDYCANGNLVDELERNFRLDYRILKFMTILIDKDVDVEALVAAMTPEETDTAETAGETDANETAAADIAQPASDTEEQS